MSPSKPFVALAGLCEVLALSLTDPHATIALALLGSSFGIVALAIGRLSP